MRTDKDYSGKGRDTMHTGSMISLGLAGLAASLLGTSAFAQGGVAAPTGGATKGTLTVRISVKGAGRLPGNVPDYQALVWKVNNTASFETRLVAMSGADLSAANAAKMAQVATAADEAIDDKVQAVIDKWNDKLDACEDEACEDRVHAAMMADPGYRRIMFAMQPKGAAVLQTAQGVDLAPGLQGWAVDPLDQYPTTGSVRVEYSLRYVGAMSETGGPRSDDAMTWVGALTLDKEPGGMAGELNFDRAAGTYTIVLAGAHMAVEARDSDGTGNVTQVPLLGSEPPKGKEWESVLKATGPAGPDAAHGLSGKLTFTSNMGNWREPTHDMPVQVTIEWSFTPGS